MAELIIKEGMYFSQLDEDAFFKWLQSIPCVTDVVGTPKGLIVTLDSERLSEQNLRDLLAIHNRYGLPMKSMAQFETPQNTSWFRSPEKYWYAKVFS
jgi:hypothetical protein